MGWRDNATKAVEAVKTWFKGDKESKIADVRRSEDRFQNGTGGTSYDFTGLANSLRIEYGLMDRYSDYEEMDDYPEISSAHDVYADDATIPDILHNQRIWATSTDAVVREILTDLLHNRLRVEEDVWGDTRGTAKYGNGYGEILLGDDGVVALVPVPAPTVRRIEDKKGVLYGFVQDVKGEFGVDKDVAIKALKGDHKIEGMALFHPWEMVHWRLVSKYVGSPYGFGISEPARWAWKRLVMLEDTTLVYKLTRSPSRYAFYIDTGDLNPHEAIAHVARVKGMYKKRKIIDPTTGKLEFRQNPLAHDEDFWFPTRGGKDSTRVETITGPDYQSMEPVEYFRTKVVSAVKVPRSYLGLGEDTSRAALSQEDVRFARSVMRLQRAMINGYRHVARVHLAAIGVDPDRVEWDIHMSVPSAIFELSQIEVMNAQADLAARLEPFMEKPWILQRVFRLTDDDAVSQVRAKAGETRDAMLRDADTQAKIMREYPELAEAGMLPGQDPGEGASGGSPPQPMEAVFELRNAKLDERLTRLERFIGKETRDLKRALRAVVGG